MLVSWEPQDSITNHCVVVIDNDVCVDDSDGDGKNVEDNDIDCDEDTGYDVGDVIDNDNDDFDSKDDNGSNEIPKTYHVFCLFFFFPVWGKI